MKTRTWNRNTSPSRSHADVMPKSSKHSLGYGCARARAATPAWGGGGTHFQGGLCQQPPKPLAASNALSMAVNGEATPVGWVMDSGWKATRAVFDKTCQKPNPIPCLSLPPFLHPRRSSLSNGPGLDMPIPMPRPQCSAPARACKPPPGLDSTQSRNFGFPISTTTHGVRWEQPMNLMFSKVTVPLMTTTAASVLHWTTVSVPVPLKVTLRPCSTIGPSYIPSQMSRTSPSDALARRDCS